MYGISGFEMLTGYVILTFLVIGIGSQRKIATGIETLKIKPDISLTILSDAINLWFCKPCGNAEEFDNVVYIPDIDTN